MIDRMSPILYLIDESLLIILQGMDKVGEATKTFNLLKDVTPKEKKELDDRLGDMAKIIDHKTKEIEEPK